MICTSEAIGLLVTVECAIAVLWIVYTEIIIRQLFILTWIHYPNLLQDFPNT